MSLTITDKSFNGNIMAEIQNGKYLYSSVAATLFRDPDSWKSFVGKKNVDGSIEWKNSDQFAGKDVTVYHKQGINWDNSDSFVVEGYQTVDNMITNSKSENLNQLYPYYMFGLGGYVQANTVISEQYNMQYFDSSNFQGGVLIKNNAYTLDGRFINNKGRTHDSEDRYLEHSNRGIRSTSDYLTLRVDGCDSTSYTNHIYLFDNLRKWNIPNDFQIKTRLRNQSYYKTPYSEW